jgi:phthiodiolone/phenolphthiodiolone dimycocerosates ketoreductase
MNHRKKQDRTEAFVAALWNWCILAEDESEGEELMNTPLARAFSLLLPDSEWKRLGHDHPLGDGFHSLTDYIPMRYSREKILQALESVPAEVLRAFYMIGDAESIIKQLEEYAHHGLQHIILWNATGMFNLEKTKPSYKILKEVLSYVKG